MAESGFRRRRSAGWALLDSLIGASILVLGAVAYFSLVPVVQRSQVIGEQQTVAVQIANRMIEHLLLLKPSTLTANNLSSLNLIDKNQSSPPYTFTNLPMDDGWIYSPAKALPSGKGTLSIKDIDGAKLITVTITWNSPNYKAMSYTTGTVLGSYR